MFEDRRAAVMHHAQLGKSIKEIAFDSKTNTSFVGQTLRLNNWESMHVSTEEREAIKAMRNLLRKT